MFKFLLSKLRKNTVPAIVVSEVTFAGSSALDDRVELFCSSHSGLMRTAERCIRKYKGDGGWIHCVHGADVESILYEDEIDFTEIKVFIKKQHQFNLKYKHSQMWIASNGIPRYDTHHPKAKTFGVLGYTPISHAEDLDKFPEPIREAIYLLAMRYGKEQSCRSF